MIDANSTDATSLEALKYQFLSHMSHELRTPINGILGNIKLLQMTQLDNEQKELVENTLSSTRRMMNFMQNILLILDAEAGRIQSHTETFSLTRLLEGVLEDRMKDIQKKGQQVLIQVEDNVEDLMIADRSNLNIILRQLLDNAIKFSTSGQITLKAERVGDYQMDQHVACLLQLSVIDNGIGIDANLLPQLAKWFTVENTTHTRRYQGAGIGLALCKELVSYMKGSITIESTFGKGTVVHVTIPVKHHHAHNNLPHMYVDEQKQSHVLIVDDDNTSRVVLGMFCEHYHIKPMLAASGLEAIRQLQLGLPFDCVFIDIQMPGMSGLQVVEKIRADIDTPQKKNRIVGVTAYASKGDQERFISYGMDDCITKPINREKFEDIARKWHLI